MLFHSEIFLFFIFSLIVVYNFSGQYKKHILLLASYIFYAYYIPEHLIILIFISLLCFAAGNVMLQEKNITKISIVIVILILGYFKYYNFIITLINDLFDTNLYRNKILLPIGISFYTFQAISYLVDINKNKNLIEQNFVSMSLYISFFPQILAGPIERSSKLLPQINSLNRLFITNVIIGFKFIVWGLFCKMVIADNLSLIVNTITYDINSQYGSSLILMPYIYGFQIYFDFYGYSIIAIGIAKIFGIKLSINFNSPYTAISFREFWHRWHITLSKWFRDYIYIPLGGSRNKFLKLIGILMLVFLISGIWHGASYNFILWGLGHFILYTFEKLIIKINVKNNIELLEKPMNFAKWFIVFNLVMLLWVFFKIDDLTILVNYFNQITSINNLEIDKTIFSNRNLFILIITTFTFYVDSNGFIKKYLDYNEVKLFFNSNCLLFYLQIIFILFIGSSKIEEFIYFNF
jgi:D-alanyl-lipoteichoic acid acyltransferase DltB (MBOAT superfamily)